MNQEMTENSTPVSEQTVPQNRLPVQVHVSSRGLALNSLDEMWRWATCVVKSGLAPKGFNEAAVIVATQMGLELGLTPMAALQNIAAINGRPGIFGDAAKAVVESSGLMIDYDEHAGRWCDGCEVEGDATRKCPRCGQKLEHEDFKGFIVISHRRGRKHPIISGFNVRQARAAGLWGKQGPWSQYPNRMLKWRARGFNLRDNFPDVLKGFRTTEELQDTPVDIIEHQAPPTGHGRLVDLKPKPAPPPGETPAAETEPESGGGAFEPNRTDRAEIERPIERQPGEDEDPDDYQSPFANQIRSAIDAKALATECDAQIDETRNANILRNVLQYIQDRKDQLGPECPRLLKKCGDKILSVEKSRK